jgi:hypothetical protein
MSPAACGLELELRRMLVSCAEVPATSEGAATAAGCSASLGPMLGADRAGTMPAPGERACGRIDFVDALTDGTFMGLLHRKLRGQDTTHRS